jgi:hypothetical protein
MISESSHDEIWRFMKALQIAEAAVRELNLEHAQEIKKAMENEL